MSEPGVAVTEATSVDRDGWDRFVAAHPVGEAGHRWALLELFPFGPMNVWLERAEMLPEKILG